ncbi:MAG: hypothetical protein HY053_07825 [Proteobacteria bacterium]|nr:hypothetical protein [Pseudomonadota bacterium]
MSVARDQGSDIKAFFELIKSRECHPKLYLIPIRQEKKMGSWTDSFGKTWKSFEGLLTRQKSLSERQEEFVRSPRSEFYSNDQPRIMREIEQQRIMQDPLWNDHTAANIKPLKLDLNRKR